MSKVIRCAVAIALVSAVALVVPLTASAATSPSAQIKAVYKTVFTAEYFGPLSAVCSNLTASGSKTFVKDFQVSNCIAAAAAVRQTLTHKTKGDEDSGYTPAQWRKIVSLVVGHLKITVHGTHATAISALSGIPGEVTLTKVGGAWKFSSVPPLEAD